MFLGSFGIYFEDNIHSLFPLSRITFLIFSGIIKGQLQLPEQPTRMLEMCDLDCYLQSEHSGILEMCVSLGDDIEAGQLVARIYSLERTGEPPKQYFAQRNGVLAARRHPCLIAIGDTFAVLAVPIKC